jgi:predicted RNA binding protein YcfA (HicA-like mRNA interferase family)
MAQGDRWEHATLTFGQNCPTVTVVKSAGLLRRPNRLATRRGWDIIETRGAGSHLKVRLNGKTTVIAMHRTDMPSGTFRKILKDLSLTVEDLEV